MKRFIAMMLTIAMLCSMMVGCGRRGGSSGMSAKATEGPQIAQPPQAEQPVRNVTPTEKVADTFAVHAYIPSSWGNGNIWAWSDTEGDAFDVWPGMAMIPEGDGWYYYEVPKWVNRVVINGLGGSVQTGDIEIESREVWIGLNEDGSGYMDYDGRFEIAPEGYIAELQGEYESVHLSDGNFSLNIHAMVFPEMVYNCYEMTVNMQVEMNAGTSCKDWQLWGRTGGKFVKLEKLYLEAGNGFLSQTVTFDTPVSFDALAITPTVPGGYSWSLVMLFTDVWTL